LILDFARVAGSRIVPKRSAKVKGKSRLAVMTESRASKRHGQLHCKKFGRGVKEEDAICSKPDDYCEFRERCGIFFLMTERMRDENNRAQEDKDAFV
jgi:hypothetical protein